MMKKHILLNKDYVEVLGMDGKFKQKNRYILTTLAVVISAILQVFVLQTFVYPAQLLSGGFTGVAILVSKIAELNGISISVSLGMILLNAPVALFCFKHIGKKFVVFSLIQVFLTSFLLGVFSFTPIFDDILLNVIFAGAVYGFSIALALRGNASTGGTDFIALYISNKRNKAIWEYVFAFNAIILIIYGVLFGFEHAGYSIVFQYITTKVISSFYQRYHRVTLQITTKKPKEVVAAYKENIRHGMSVLDGYGAYSGEPMSVLHTVVSSYEIQDIVQLIKSVDPKVIINVIPTETFVGGFYQRPIE